MNVVKLKTLAILTNDPLKLYNGKTAFVITIQTLFYIIVIR